jgi:malonyl-CoA O-methyltransferase
MFRGLFITGTDTDVGKTTVAAAVLHRYRKLGALKYWKPVQTGINCSESELHLAGVRLPGPVAPYLAAERTGTRIAVADIIAHGRNQPDSIRWIAEGAGGVLVPINESQSMIDLMAQIGMPALVVARPSLGTINHTLLTLEALRRRQIGIAGVILAGDPNTDNRRAVERFGNVLVIGEMPRFEVLTPEVLGRWATSDFDTSGQLARYFQ